MYESHFYKKLQLFISTGILFGIWSNLFIQSSYIKSKSYNTSKNDNTSRNY